MKYRFENVKVVHVVDGDTIDVEIDFGFYIKTKQRLRLFRVNAWEARGEDKQKGLEAKEWLQMMLKDSQIVIDTEKQGKYGRFLAEVWIEEQMSRRLININDLLVEKGHAKYQEY